MIEYEKKLEELRGICEWLQEHGDEVDAEGRSRNPYKRQVYQVMGLHAGCKSSPAVFYENRR